MTLQPAPINRRELFLRACRGEVLPRVPVWIMRQAGRYLPEYREIRAKHAFLEVCKTPQLAVEVSIQPFRRLGVDAVIVFSDILIPAEAMGLQLELGDAGPNLPNPVRSKLDVDRLKMFDPEAETGFLPEAIRRIVKSVGPEVPVLGFAGAPWTLACYMVEGKAKEGFATVKSFLYSEPKTFRVLLHRIAQATIPYLKAQIAAGATAVQLFDTWGGELNLQDYEDFPPCCAGDHLGTRRFSPGDLLHEGVATFASRRSSFWRKCAQRGLARGFGRNSQTAGSQNCIARKCRSRRLVRSSRENSRCDAGHY